MGLRVRWRLVAKGAGVLLAGLVAWQLIPALLEPPTPEPLPADVGLPSLPAQTVEPPERLRQAPVGQVVSGRGVPAGRRPVFRPNRDLGRRRPRRKAQPGRDTPARRQDPSTDASVPAVRKDPAGGASVPAAPAPARGSAPPVPEPPTTPPDVPSPAPEPVPAPPPPPSAPPDDGSMEFAPH